MGFSKFRCLFQRAVSQVSTVSLIHSGLLQSQLMGEQKTNLLREVYCESTLEGIMYFEPTHVQWVPCRKHFVETTEIEIAKSNGELLQLNAGKTIANLVFIKV